MSATASASTLSIQGTREFKDFEIGLRDFENQAFNFGERFIQDSHARMVYKRLTLSTSEAVMNDVLLGKLKPLEGAKIAHQLRNSIMDMIRNFTSDIGLAVAQSVKSEGRTFEFLLDRKAQKLF